MTEIVLKVPLKFNQPTNHDLIPKFSRFSVPVVTLDEEHLLT